MIYMNRTILLLLVALCYQAAVFAQEETGAYINGIYYDTYFDTKEMKSCAEVAYGKYPDGYPSGDIVVEGKVVINGKEYEVKQIGMFAMDWVKPNTKVSLPNGIYILQDHCFGSPYNGKRIDLDMNFGNIELLYVGCLSSAKLPDEVYMPKVRSIGPNTLVDVTTKKLVLGGNLSSVGWCAFSGSMIEELVFEDGTHADYFNGMNPYLSNNAFRGMRIKELKLPKWQNMAIGDCVVDENIDLERVVFPDVPSIEYGYNDYVYKNVTSIQPVYGYFFMECPNLTEVVCLGAVPPVITEIDDFADRKCYKPTNATSFEFMDNIDDCVLKVPAGSEELYRADPVWGKFKTIYGFENGDYTSIVMPEVVAPETEAVPVYHNLQGMKVERPEHGQLYIRTVGSRTDKVVY